MFVTEASLYEFIIPEAAGVELVQNLRVPDPVTIIKSVRHHAKRNIVKKERSNLRTPLSVVDC
jgi:hypothetical protein